MEIQKKRRPYKYQVQGKLIAFSDPHFFHRNILLYDRLPQFLEGKDLDLYEEYHQRGTRVKLSEDGVHRMNAAILENINNCIDNPSTDTVLCLGDFVHDSDPEYRRHAIWVRDNIRCDDVRLTLGNHDLKHMKDLRDLFTFSYYFATLEVGNYSFFCQHFPVASWSGSGNKIGHLHGHVHGLYRDPHKFHHIARPEIWPAVDVGLVTNNMKPYTKETILERLVPIWERQSQAKRATKQRLHHEF